MPGPVVTQFQEDTAELGKSLDQERRRNEERREIFCRCQPCLAADRKFFSSKFKLKQSVTPL
jgi:hypothetical protein